MIASRCVGGVRIPCFVFLLVVVLAIFAYGAILRKTGLPDALERPVVDDPAWVGFDGWGATHLFFWAFVGFWFPGHEVQALAVSLLWEGIEDTLGRANITLGGSRLQLVGAVDETTGEQLGPRDGEATGARAAAAAGPANAREAAAGPANAREAAEAGTPANAHRAVGPANVREAGEAGTPLWYGRFTSDTAFNLAGYIVGSALARRYWPANTCKCPACRA